MLYTDKYEKKHVYKEINTCEQMLEKRKLMWRTIHTIYGGLKKNVKMLLNLSYDSSKKSISDPDKFHPKYFGLKSKIHPKIRCRGVSSIGVKFGNKDQHIVRLFL